MTEKESEETKTFLQSKHSIFSLDMQLFDSYFGRKNNYSPHECIQLIDRFCEVIGLKVILLN